MRQLLRNPGATRRSAPSCGRSRPAVACHAPFTSMYLDQRGQVRACCKNDFHLLGNVTEALAAEIWRGPKAGELRRAMERQDLGSVTSASGRWPRAGYDLAFAAMVRPVPRGRPRPRVAATARAVAEPHLQPPVRDVRRRVVVVDPRASGEGLSAAPEVYDDAFFADLRPFLPHLRRVKFLGGEPFLAARPCG